MAFSFPVTRPSAVSARRRSSPLDPRRWLRHASRLLLAPRCLVCAARGQADLDLCADCVAALPWNHDVCRQCALPLEGGAARCGHCVFRPPPWALAQSALRYAFPVDRLLPRFKFHGDLAAGEALATLLQWSLDPAESPDALVPVPLHWRRGWSRRYNQSGALARVIARQTGVKVAGDALRRVRPTQQQIGLSRSQRASNVQGAFKVAAERAAEVQGRRLILIDDVLTSGATTDACARALLRAKAASVDVLVFARVVDTFKAPI